MTNHYKAKRIAEQELITLLENSGWQNGTVITTDQEAIKNATKPLFYKINVSQYADDADLDGVRLYLTYKDNANESMDSGNVQNFNRANYSITIFRAGDDDKIAVYIETLLDNLEVDKWYYDYISEDKVDNINTNKIGYTIIYNIKKILKTKNTNKIYTAI